MCISENDKLKKFIRLRNKYIDLLEKKEITKSEFNHKNNEIYSLINLRPFSVLDSFEKALFNYNYYNSKAKICLEEYNRFKKYRNEKKSKIANNNKLNNYYHKDEALIAMISMEDPINIKAYFINMYSKNLSKEIFEIIFLGRERVILHSKNPIIKKILLEKKCFCEEEKESLISNYINN